MSGILQVPNTQHSNGVTGETIGTDQRRRNDGSTLGTLTFTNPSVQILNNTDQYIADDDAIIYDITSLGVGAANLTVTLWCRDL